MAPKSPSMAFEPTPALDLEKENFSPLTDHPNAGTQRTILERRSSKEVHFSPPIEPARRAQSLATSVPFLEPVSSASPLPPQNIRIKNVPPEVDMNAYMEQSRGLLESQRLNFEREREIFEKERKLWNAERVILKARVADLEMTLNKTNNGKRRFSNGASSASEQSFRNDLGQRPSFGSLRASRGSSETNGSAPVWRTSDMGATVTRVFSNEEQQTQSKKPVPTSNGLPSIAENAAAAPVSPRSVPVPVAMLDSSLDGITLKSAGLESSFVRVQSPTSTSPPQPPSPGPQIHKDEKILRMSLDGLLSPTDANLVKNAGHTPMEFGKPAVSGETASGAESRKSPEADAEATAPKHESRSGSKPNRPPMPPSERSDSYFSTAFEIDMHVDASQRDAGGDVRLKGPLTMENKPGVDGEDSQFLSQLDARLLAESKRSREEPHIDDQGANGGFSKLNDDVDDGGPRLKLKKSMNFGSAFGSMKCGNI
jgi:hypothetical protein